jgi:nicotinamide-nucleotide amidase
VLAEILTIGDELCRGEIVDTNSSWMAEQLWELGVTVAWMSSCRDDADDMRRALREATSRVPLVFVSGGLGPTEDDLTVDIVSEVAGVGIDTDPTALERMTKRYETLKFALTPNNLRQVRIPRGATSLGNPAGAAPGFLVKIGGATLIAMPGVPREMKAIWADAVVPRVRELAASGEKLARKVFRVFGKGESHIDHALQGLGAGVAGATVHYQVAFPETLVKLVVRDGEQAAADARLAAMEKDLRSRLGELVYGEEKDSLAAVLGRALGEKGATLACAESCTGGLLGALVTDVAGSSAYFKGSIVAYANEVKVRDLGVPDATLAAHGAVSQATAEAMAAGVRDRFRVTYGVAVTGIAGPGGGTPEKPVGTVHAAVAGPKGVVHKHLFWPFARDMVRRLAAYWAMALVLKVVRDE